MPKRQPDNQIMDMLERGLVMTGDDERLDIHFLPIGIPTLDGIMGGGVPYNRVTAIVGPETTGKTILMQYIAAAVQRTDRPYFLLMDLEHSYDRRWWEASGVDPSRLMVSQPMFGEEAIDVMVAALKSSKEIGGVGIDSIPAMTPKIIAQAESAEDRTIGQLPVLVNIMLAEVIPLIHDCVFVHTNQMRASIGSYEEKYPGGLGLRHGTHLRLRTRREGWLKEGTERVGFTMEVIVYKNKQGQSYGECQLPFRFNSQIDLVQSYIDEAISKHVIIERLPYYTWNDYKWHGKAQIRDWFVENKGALVLLKERLSA